MMLLDHERVGVFIDWENTRTSLEILSSMHNRKITIPWEEFRKFYFTCSAFARFYLYGAHNNSPELRELEDRLHRLSFNVLLKRTQLVDRERGWKNRKNADVELTVDVMSSVNLFDHIVIFSGDGDFSYLVEWLKRNGKRVTIVSQFNIADSRTNTASRALIQEADTFIQLEEFVSALESWTDEE